jgi:hypothetical protein
LNGFLVIIYNLNSIGNVNVWKNINYDDDLVKWHYIYYGYSRNDRTASGVVIFKDRTEKVAFTETNHYLPKNV